MDPTTLGNLATALSAWGAAFLVALWLSLIYWTYRDAQARLRDRMRRLLAVALSVVLFIPGVIIYLLLRPTRTLEEEYLLTLEEEALLRAIEESERKHG
jgi:putative flippase GtrA